MVSGCSLLSCHKIAIIVKIYDNYVKLSVVVFCRLLLFGIDALLCLALYARQIPQDFSKMRHVIGMQVLSLISINAIPSFFLWFIKNIKLFPFCLQIWHLWYKCYSFSDCGENATNSRGRISFPIQTQGNFKFYDPNLSYMDRVVMEIVETERVYVNDLHEIISVRFQMFDYFLSFHSIIYSNSNGITLELINQLDVVS